MTADHDKKQLIEVSQRVGSRIPHWTQGAGGNLSVKSGDVLWIKASGFRLDQVSGSKGLACVEIPAFQSGFQRIQGALDQNERDYAALLKSSSVPLAGGGNPSMETGFHVFLPGKWVFHFHALTALVMALEQKRDSEKFGDWLKRKSGLKMEFVEPERPGFLLSKKIPLFKDADALIMENHGVILQSDSLSALEEWAKLEILFCQEWGYPSLAELCQNEDPLNWFRGKEEFKAPIPFKIYFPDTAVFKDRISKVVEGSAGSYRLAADAWTLDKDAAEIWAATVLLHQACPQLGELPESISGTVSNLPTELIRKNRE